MPAEELRKLAALTREKLPTRKADLAAVSDTTRRASSTTLETITAALEGGDYYPRLPVTSKCNDENAGPIRAFAWPLLIQSGRLAELSGSKLQLTRTGRMALAEPAAQTIRTLWARWVGTTIVDELSRIDCVKGQTGKGKRGLHRRLVTKERGCRRPGRVSGGQMDTDRRALPAPARFGQRLFGEAQRLGPLHRRAAVRLARV